MLRRILPAMIAIGLASPAVLAEKYYLLVGVDARHYPGPQRFLSIPGGVPGPVYDGDRLAGTADIGPIVDYVGTGTPRYEPNHLGSLSMLYRRGTIPFAGGVPILGIEFLGGPLLDLDGDLADGQRSLIPSLDHEPVEIPDTDSYIELVPDFELGTLALVHFDATGCNEGGPNIQPEIATILVTLAGTSPAGEPGDPINPAVDTRTGTLTPFAGTSGTLAGVFRVTGLGFELWEDSIDPFSSTWDSLGTMQFLGTLDGWLVTRDPATGRFPTLAGEGLGSTRWPDVAAAAVGQSYNVAVVPPGGTATIAAGAGADVYTAPGNGGLPLTDFGGDLGAYLDAVVVPRLPAAAGRFVYLEAAGFGINTSMDPVYTDTIGYDVVLIAATASCGVQQRGDSNCDGQVTFDDIDLFVRALVGEEAWLAGGPQPGCTYLCVNDIDGDGAVTFDDIDPFVVILAGQG